MDTNKIWDSFIEEIKKFTSKLSFDMFFSDLSLYKLDVDNKIIYIQLEDISIIKFLREIHCSNRRYILENARG